MQALNESSLIEEVLKYIVACYGAEIYQDKQRLSNLIADLYTGEERLKRLYRRMVMEDAVSQQLYAISLKPIQEREGFYNRLVFQFKEANFLEEAFARQVLDAFLNGMNLLLVEPISTIATEEDGEWVDEYGVKYSADRKKLIRAPENLYGDYRVLDGTVVICDFAFSNCKDLCETTLPLGVTSIGKFAFFCSSLETITLSLSIKNIGEYAFCCNLREISLPLSVTSIGKASFGSCYLREITIPLGVTSIGDYAFQYCKNLQEIKVAESNKFYRAIDGVLYTKDIKTIICYPEGKEDEKFIIPSGVASIGDYAFSNCENLCKIFLPSSISSIEKYAFESCTNLREIIIPPGVVSIGDYAFQHCESLREIIIPSTVTSIGEDAFLSCKNLRKIAIPSTVTSIGKRAFGFCENLYEITLPSGVTNIGDYAFSDCSNLQEVTLPSGVTSIGDNVFYLCPNLQQINIPRGTFEKFKKLLPEWTDELHEV